MTAARDAAGERDRVVGRCALPAEPRVHLQVDTDAHAVALAGRLEKLDGSIVVHDRLQRVLG